jgi:hypothetical protein
MPKSDRPDSTSTQPAGSGTEDTAAMASTKNASEGELLAPGVRFKEMKFLNR